MRPCEVFCIHRLGGACHGLAAYYTDFCIYYIYIYTYIYINIYIYFYLFI